MLPTIARLVLGRSLSHVKLCPYIQYAACRPSYLWYLRRSIIVILCHLMPINTLSYYSIWVLVWSYRSTGLPTYRRINPVCCGPFLLVRYLYISGDHLQYRPDEWYSSSGDTAIYLHCGDHLQYRPDEWYSSSGDTAIYLH